MAFRGLTFSFRIAHNTIASIIFDTSRAISDILQLEHMPVPSEETFFCISDDFFTKRNFPTCIGCIDGKHVRIKCPDIPVQHIIITKASIQLCSRLLLMQTPGLHAVM
jgi:hypothetical protein